MENGKQPAFPLSAESEQQIREGYGFLEIGLTKREYFAGLAMQATDLEKYANVYRDKWAEEVAKDSIKMADELLKQLDN